jgi:ERF superfamily
MSENKTVGVRPLARTGTEILESIEKMVQPVVRAASNPPVERKKESDDLRELYKALSLAQKGFSAIQKTGSNQGRPYAKITDIIEACRASLRAQNLVANTFTRVVCGIQTLITRLFHYPTGQFIESELPLINIVEEQKRGASVTYAWRYTTAPLVGLVDDSEDDDGESLTKPRR